MRLLVTIALLTVPMPDPVLAAPAAQSPLMAPVRLWIEGFNANQPQLAARAFAPDAVIIDEVPPYRWQGPTALADWAAAAAKGAEAFHATNLHATLGNPTWSEINGDIGYMVVPEAVDSLVDGKANCERGLHSFSFRNIGGEWKITASAFAVSEIVSAPCNPA